MMIFSKSGIKDYLESNLVRKDFYDLDHAEKYDIINSCLDYFVVRDEEDLLFAVIDTLIAHRNPQISFVASLIKKYYDAEHGIIGEFAPEIVDENGFVRFKDEVDLIFECKSYLKEAVNLYLREIDDIEQKNTVLDGSDQ